MSVLHTASRWHYLGVLGACLLGTLPLEVVLGARVYRRPWAALRAVVAAGAPFLAVDWWAVERGLWRYSPRYVLGLRIGGVLPLEVVLFFVVIPVCALLTFAAVTALRPRRFR